MGCILGKNSKYTPPSGMEKLKRENGFGKIGNVERPIVQRQEYGKENMPGGKLSKQEGEKKPVVLVYGGNVGGEKVGGREVGRNENGRNTGKRTVLKKIGAEELVDGWPKWLVDNIPREVLAGLVPKSADSYEKLTKVGHGTYSNVYKARDRNSGKIVALKKVRFDTSEPESVKFMAREIMILQKLDHPNIIKLEGLATSRMQYSLYLVFDFMQSDLTRIIARPGERLTEPQVKCYMQQLLAGLQHCHERGILHRDIKSSNLLIDKNGMLKIGDFGLANFYIPKPKRSLTSRVVTLWYRAPELLLGSTDYGVGIDLWSAGCLFAEMFIGRPILPGRTEVEQLHRIFKLCGSPPEDYWKIMKLPTSFRPPQHYRPCFQEAFKDYPESSFGLLTTLLELNPGYRGTAASALQSQFFTSSPLACQISLLPVVQRVDNEPTQTKDRKKHKTSKKKSSRPSHEGERRIILVAPKTNDDVESSKENLEAITDGQETGNSGSSTLSSLKPINEERSLPLSFSPIRRSHDNRARQTESRPNAVKNIQNYALLQASMMDIVKHNGGNGMPSYCRSVSTLDFRTLDPEKISKLFGLEKD